MKPKEQAHKSLKTLKTFFLNLENQDLLRRKDVRKMFSEDFTKDVFRVERYISALEAKSPNGEFLGELDINKRGDKLLYDVISLFELDFVNRP